jgi:hypothetical protein
MSILRLAYTAQFLIALIAVFVLWSQVGGQSHLDLMAWYLKLGLGAGVAFAVVKATAAAVSHERAWNGRTLKWLGIMVALLVGCGLASYYCHMYLESDEEDDQQDSATVGRASWSVCLAQAKITAKPNGNMKIRDRRGDGGMPRTAGPAT